MNRLIIIGGVAAGMSAAAKAKRLRPGLTVDVYTDEIYASYSGCCLPYYAQGVMEEIDDLIVRTPEQLKEQGVNLHLGRRVSAIDPIGKTVTVESLQGSKDSVQNNMADAGQGFSQRFPKQESTKEVYDKLIIATGARPVIPDIPGKDHPAIHSVKRIEDVVQIRNLLRDGKAKRAVIVGGGFIGIEMVEALYAYGAEISLVEMAPQILTILDEDMAKIIECHLAEKGVAVYKNEQVAAIREGGGCARVITNARELTADIILMAVGVEPNSGIAREAGIKLGARGAILVDNYMRTSAPDIYAAGDCATARNMLTGTDMYIPLGTTANKQGRIAGENAVGGVREFQGVIGTTIFKALDMEGSCTGLSLEGARAAGFDAWESVVTADTIVDAYPGAGKMTVKLVMERGSNRLLGGQIAGSQKSAKRIDVLVSLIQTGASLHDLARLDLSYAPPFADVWDALLVAANVALARA